MTLSRRSFSFASLAALLGANTARAAGPEAQQQQQAIPELDEPPAPPAQTAKVLATVAKDGGALVVTLTVHNPGADPLDVLVAFGSRPAGEVHLTAAVAGGEVELEQLPNDVDRREMMSRMGPMPRWVNVGAGGRVDIGPFRYALPKGAEPPFTVRGAFDGAGSLIRFEVKGLGWASKST